MLFSSLFQLGSCQIHEAIPTGLHKQMTRRRFLHTSQTLGSQARMEERHHTRPGRGKGLIEAHASDTTETKAPSGGPGAFAPCRAAAAPFLLTRVSLTPQCPEPHTAMPSTPGFTPSLLPLGAHLSAHRARSWAGGAQNHRILGVGRSPRQGRLQQVTQERSQVGFKCLPSRRLHGFPEPPVPVLRHPQCKESLPHVEVELLEF